MTRQPLPSVPPAAVPPAAPARGASPVVAFDRARLGRRGFLLGAAGAALALTGCSSDDDGKGGAEDGTKNAEGGATASAGATASTDAAAFPVTVAGKEGTVKVTSAPKRVAACGYLRDTDLALALGAPLVLATKNAVFPSGLAPWQKPTTDPELVDSTKGLPFEKIAAAAPDLILAADDYQLADDYATLSHLAPTLSYRRGVGQDSWQDMAARTGQVLGKRAQAEALVARVQAKIAAVHAQHPELQGKTFTFGPVSGGEAFTIKSPTDASAVFFSQLGMTLAPQVTSLPDSATPGRAAISRERLDLLDADVVILTFATEPERKSFEAQPLFRKLKAVRRGSYLALDMPTAIAVAFPSVLSLPYGLDAVVPKLAAAAGRGA
ncbi:iron-siderophore ABC transporter substrate-binding protein [Actinacidiphila sp. DG2A-62]|uniref:iron-siderophore ABC transporter substrate-binding protein n=1 Tax=Actinacidiphila sp. DG2A-62 TaxID=3108821 RepID=UPI002DBED807|nr:iron-siderophore ABC transporter substrate-binding protein [Actinacidiphila sp. DG2A-62]MEC3993911.1 iron-siderophore ABC transporter substrate-binding protein [Actinacidiphila sp. DG2A-62]